MGSLNEIVKKGRSLSFGDAVVGLILIYFCIMGSKVFFLTIGVSMADYVKYELFYILIGAFIASVIAWYIILGHRTALRNKYSSGSI